MDKATAISNAVQTAENHGFNLPGTLNTEVENLATPKYRVAVVGKYQVGKSTLINHVFLKDNPILLEGDGLCTTSVTTEVEYGPAPRLEVYNWTDSTKSEEVLDTTTDNPTKENLESATVGEDRVALANKVSKVKVFTPNEALKQYTILDTPGIDDPNQEILQNTTYRIIPTCDLAILVVEPRALDQANLELLRKNIIRDGIARLMVLISYRPENHQNEDMRIQIIDAIKAQLANIGKEKIPVEMYCFDETVEDILCTVDQISLCISSFLMNNALAGRQEHVATHLRAFLDNCLLDIASKLKAAGQTAANNAELANKVQAQLAEIKEKSKAIQFDLKHEFEGIKRSADAMVQAKVAGVFLEFKQELQNAPTLSAVQSLLKNADQALKIKLTDAVNDCASKVEVDVRTTLLAKEKAFGNVALEWDNFLQDKLNVDGGFMTKIPSLLLEIADIIALDIILPGGIFIAFIAKICQRIIPILKQLVLGNAVKAFLLRKAEASLSELQNRTIVDIQTKISSGLGKALENIGQTLDAQYEQQAKTITNNLNAAQAVDNSALENAQAEIKKVMEEL